MSHTILHIDSSPLGERSISRKLTAKVLAELKVKHPDSKVITRDFGANSLPHLSGTVIGAFFTPPDKRDAALSEAIKLSDQAVDELAEADVIIIGTPMWNFGIPSSLKAWIDHIVRAGRTFKYGANGSESLLPAGKKVIIVSSRGGVYSDGPMKSMDYQETYLKAIFGFIGFYFIDKRHLGIDFNLRQSFLFACRNFLLMNDEGITPLTRFGHEFIWMAHTLGFIAWSFLVFTIVKPYFNRRNQIATSREKAYELVERFGDSPVDHFKTYRDKLFYFSDQFEAFIAYRIANGFAIVLEEPVCADHYKIPVLQEFDKHCHKMSLKTAYYRVDETGISYFNYLKKRKLLIGQEAVLELDKFTLEGREKKSVRNALNSLQKKGYTAMV